MWAPRQRARGDVAGRGGGGRDPGVRLAVRVGDRLAAPHPLADQPARLLELVVEGGIVQAGEQAVIHGVGADLPALGGQPGQRIQRPERLKL